MEVKAGFVIVCGLISSVLSLPNHHFDKRIINGQTTVRGEWPFLVSLHYNKPNEFTKASKMKHVCGGALIHPRWVLTAAHCMKNTDYKDMINPENWDAVVGEYNQFVEDEDEQFIKPEDFFPHPDFDLSEKSVFMKDIGLIKLKQDAILGPYTGVVPMDKRKDLAENTKCKVGGWGQVAEAPSGWGMYIPLETTVYSFNYNLCLQRYKNFTHRPAEFAICAGVPLEKQSSIERSDGGVSDACQGDSGGPLICRDRNDEFVLSGIVSTGWGCGKSMFPGIYAKVSYFQNWIKETIQNNTN